MTLTNRDSDNRSSNDPVINWLLDADPSIRWQAMRDLTDAPAEIAAAERSRVASEGWGSRLLDEQRPDGQWGDGVATPFWWSNMYTLVFLRDLGLDPASPRARTAIGRVRGSVTWGPEFKKSPFFEGEVEPCINGRVVALGAYFGERSDRLVDRLLGEQLADGGWNCEAERGSVRSSFHTTICVLEGLFAFERTFGATKPVTDARTRAHEYLLERRLLRRLSTGDIIDTKWKEFAFPTLWHYDVLRALDYLRSAGVPPDSRVEAAVAVVSERRQGDGRWLLDVRHRDTLYEAFSGPVGSPNRWITLRALRVLDWAAGRPDFSGEWILNRDASTLSAGADTVQSAVWRIDHHEPVFHHKAAFVFPNGPRDYEYELRSDAGAVVSEQSGVRTVSTLEWEGKALVVTWRSEPADAGMTISFRNELIDGGRRLRASETLRGTDHDQNNIWVFERR